MIPDLIIIICAIIIATIPSIIIRGIKRRKNGNKKIS